MLHRKKTSDGGAGYGGTSAGLGTNCRAQGLEAVCHVTEGHVIKGPESGSVRSVAAEHREHGEVEPSLLDLSGLRTEPTENEESWEYIRDEDLLFSLF